MDRFIVLKLFPPGVQNDEDDRARFLNEAKVVAVLNHPSICTIYEIDESAGRPFIAMEFVGGESLDVK